RPAVIRFVNCELRQDGVCLPLSRLPNGPAYGRSPLGHDRLSVDNDRKKQVHADDFGKRHAQLVLQGLTRGRACLEYLGALGQLGTSAGGDDQRRVLGLLGLVDQPVERGVGRKLEVIGGRLRTAFDCILYAAFGEERRNRESNSTGLRLNSIPGGFVADQIWSGLQHQSKGVALCRSLNRLEQGSVGRRVLAQNGADHLNLHLRPDVLLARVPQAKRCVGIERQRLGNAVRELQAVAGADAALLLDFGGPGGEPSRRLLNQGVSPDGHLKALFARFNSDSVRGGPGAATARAAIGCERSLVGRAV